MKNRDRNRLHNMAIKLHLKSQRSKYCGNYRLYYIIEQLNKIAVHYDIYSRYRIGNQFSDIRNSIPWLQKKQQNSIWEFAFGVFKRIIYRLHADIESDLQIFKLELEVVWLPRLPCFLSHVPYLHFSVQQL